MRTKRVSLFAVMALVLCGLQTVPAGADQVDDIVEHPTEYVDPIIGTTNAGNTHPGAVVPFGMVTWGPDQSYYSNGSMRTASPSGYEYNRNHIRGFSLTHVSGAGCVGLSGDLPFMPWTESVGISPSAADSTGQPYTATFSHANEQVKAGRYQVSLDSGIDVDLSATTRGGVGNFTYPDSANPTMLVRTSDSLVGSSDASILIDPDTQTISGSVTSGNFCGPFTSDGILQKSYYTVYFTATFDSEFTETGTWTDQTVSPGATEANGGTTYGSGYPPAGKGSGGWVSFADRDINMRVGISYTSLEGAKANLAAEIGADESVDQIATRATESWDKELRSVEIGGGTEDERETFYSALYHSLLHPNTTSDIDGKYRGFDQEIHQLESGQSVQYATFSGWDVYRSQIQLVTLLNPDRGADIAQSLLNQANQNGGIWDRWTHNSGDMHVMVGDPSAISVAAIVAFGATEFPVQEAFDSLAQAARVPTEKDLTRKGWNVAVEGQRPSLDQFLEYGYYPEGCNAWGCANETLEMAAADYGLSTLANYLGDEAAATEFISRSQSWMMQFNPNATAEGGYFQQRMADGTWVSGFDPSRGSGFVEGTAAHYVWMVQHNLAGLADAMGGKESAANRLDDHFKDANGNWVLVGSWDNNSFANMDNEPSVATPWIYNYLGQPWKTQETVRETIDRLWLTSKDGIPNGADGIPGNDDLGAMSSWLVFASMGLYPQNPSQADLTVAAPLFPHIKVTRASGAQIQIEAPGANLGTPYIQSMQIDGQDNTKTYLPAQLVSSLTGNHQISYSVSSEPNTNWGIADDDAPPSERNGEHLYTVAVTPSVSATPGGLSGEITLSAQRLLSSANGELTYQIEVDEGLQIDQTEGVLNSGDGNGEYSAVLRVRANEDTQLGSYEARINVLLDGNLLEEKTVRVDVTDRQERVLETSFEDGQPQAGANIRLNNTGFGDYCCSIGGVESKVQGGDARSGSKAVVFSARALEQGADATNVLVDVDEITAQSGSTFGFSIYPQETGGPFGDYIQNASKYVSVDLLFTDGSRLGDSDATAQNGATLDPVDQAQVVNADKWNDIQIALPDDVDGKLIDKVILRFHVDEVYHQGDAKDGYVRGWVDDIYLSVPVPDLSITAATGLTTPINQPLDTTWATFDGGKGDSAESYRATMTWGDNDEEEDLMIVKTEEGYSVVGNHTFVEAGSIVSTLKISDADEVWKTTQILTTVEDEVEIPQTPEYQTTRFAGDDRYQTASKISAEKLKDGVPIYIAVGQNYADSLVVGPAVAQTDGALLLSRSDSLSTEVQNQLRTVSPSEVYLIGGTKALSTAIEKQVREIYGEGFTKDHLHRIYGSDRYETALAVQKQFFPEPEQVFVTTGTNFADAISASAAAGLTKSPVALVRGTEKASKDVLSLTTSADSVVIVGGTKAVSEVTEVSLGASNLKRLGGSDRYQTSEYVNRYLDSLLSPEEVSRVWIASGQDFPDALVASSRIAEGNSRMFLTRKFCLPQAVVAAIATKSTVVKTREVFIVGGQSAISSAAENLNVCRF